jgi:hypothetical protein
MAKNNANAARKTEAVLEDSNTAGNVATPATSSAPPASTVASTIMLGSKEHKLDGSEAQRIIDHFGGKSNAIRGLHSMGLKTGPIAKAVGVIYQHARNVLKQPLKKQANQTPAPASSSPPSSSAS